MKMLSSFKWGKLQSAAIKNVCAHVPPGQFTDSPAYTQTHSHTHILTHSNTHTHVSCTKARTELNQAEFRSQAQLRSLSPRSGPGQTLIRSDNHGVPPKGMNCNFLFRGINCRPCRSLGWIRPPFAALPLTLVLFVLLEFLRFFSCQCAFSLTLPLAIPFSALFRFVFMCHIYLFI